MIDPQTFRDQWAGYKQWVRFRREASLSALIGYFRRASKQFQDQYDQVITVMKIFKPKHNSSFENENVFSHHKEVVTQKRNALGDQQVESLVKLSHESRRRYGDERYKTVDLIPAVLPHKSILKKVHNQQAAERMKKVRAKLKSVEQNVPKK